MKKVKFILLIFVLVFFIYGCATSKAIKSEYNKNKQQDNWDTKEEIKTIGKGMKTDLYSIFILPIKNIFTGRIFKETPQLTDDRSCN